MAALILRTVVCAVAQGWSWDKMIGGRADAGAVRWQAASSGGDWVQPPMAHAPSCARSLFRNTGRQQ